MTVKFIVTRSGQVVFGDRSYQDDMHYKVARRNGIQEHEIANGGIADLETRKIWGKSYDFGPYDKEYLMNLMPDWDIAVPGNY